MQIASWGVQGEAPVFVPPRFSDSEFESGAL